MPTLYALFCCQYVKDRASEDDARVITDTYISAYDALLKRKNRYLLLGQECGELVLFSSNSLLSALKPFYLKSRSARAKFHFHWR
jgi:hypothetical protein